MHALLDFSFRNFLTTRLVKVVYLVQLVLIAIWAIVALLSFFRQGFGLAVLGTIVVPIAACLGAMVARMFAELVIVVFRGVELLGQIEENQKREGAPAA